MERGQDVLVRDGANIRVSICNEDIVAPGHHAYIYLDGQGGIVAHREGDWYSVAFQIAGCIYVRTLIHKKHLIEVK